MLKTLFSKTNALFWPIIKRGWLTLLVTSVGCEVMHRFFTNMQAASQGTQTSGPNIIAVFGDLCVSLLEFVVLTMLIPQHALEIEANRPPESFWGFAARHTKQLSLESIRALGFVIFWSLLFVLPGIFKYIRYFLVPYVVVADPAYRRGDVDALEESNALVKGITLPLGVFVFILIGIDALQSSLRENYGISDAPIFTIVTTVGFFVLNYYANILLFVIYQLRKKVALETIKEGSL